MLKITCSGGVFTTLTVLLSILTTCTAADDDYHLNEQQNFILNGVTTVLRTCTPASMSLLNDNAFPILTGNNGGVRRAHVAAAEWGNGRIVAYSHTSFYINDLPDSGVENDNVKLAINSINWIRKDLGNKIGVYAEKQIENVLLDYGFEMHVLSYGDLNNLTLLEGFDALVVSKKNPAALTNLRTFVWNGGGLLVAGTAWAGDVNDIKSYWANVILEDTGILCTPFYSYGSEVCEGECFDTATDLLKDTNAFQVWQNFSEFKWNQQTMSRDRLKQMMETLFDRLWFGPIDETFNVEVNTEAKRILSSIPAIVPTPNAPVLQENEKQFIIAHRYWTMLLNAVGVTDNIPPHPSAIIFPGTSSLKRIPNQSERRLQEVVEIDGRIKWHSTGLYAQPGELIKIQALTADSSITDLEIQIGIHSDNLENLDKWTRCPYIVFRNRIKNGSATIVNPFGGPIFVVTSIPRNDSFKFVIDGGIPSPTYFLGRTNLVEWKNDIRNYPAPWGELVGKNLIVSIQSSHLSQLNNPEEVINFWDLTMDVMADLAGISHDRDTPSRFVADVQIGGGYMHSGYPIMFYLERQTNCMNLTEMRADPWILWGYLHELGHNHQVRDWTFTGTGEVTNNLFALYVLHTLFDCPTNSTNSYSDANVAQRIKTYVENGKKFSLWQSNYDLAFDTYVQLQEAFGWSAYKKVFGNYRLLSQEERPTTDEERIDLWMIMFSRAVEENLTEFFVSWGFPISTDAMKAVDYLPPTSFRIPPVPSPNKE